MSSKIEISDSEWASMKAMISDQLDNVTSNLEELREKGSLEAIAQMIQRGDRFPTARIQAWYHAMLEAEMCLHPHSVSQKLNYMYKSHSTSNNTTQSFILDTSLTAQSDSEEWKRRSGRPLETPQSIIQRLESKTNLTVQERNTLWLAKKNFKSAEAKAMKVKAEKTAEDRATTAPNLSQSRRSFSSISGKERKMSTVRSNTPRPQNTVSRKRSITSTTTRYDSRSLGNITNQTEANKRQKIKTGQGNKKKKMPPISDPFASK